MTNEVKDYRVTLNYRDSKKNSESFVVNPEDKFQMNGQEFTFEEISQITVTDADNGGWGNPDKVLEAFSKHK